MSNFQTGVSVDWRGDVRRDRDRLPINVAAEGTDGAGVRESTSKSVIGPTMHAYTTYYSNQAEALCRFNECIALPLVRRARYFETS